jgi:predicted nucleic acid-binding protein
MPGTRTRIYWDTNCFLYYLNDHPTWAPLLEYYLTRAKLGEIEIVTSVLSLSEAIFTAEEAQQRTLSSAENDRIEVLFLGEGITLVEVSTYIAQLARTLQRERLHRNWTVPGKNLPDPKIPDLLHFATALYMRVAEMHTMDEKLHRFSDIVGIKISFPPPKPPDPPKQLSLINPAS